VEVPFICLFCEKTLYHKRVHRGKERRYYIICKECKPYIRMAEGSS
jgi:transcription elongation factor Elf1